MRQMVLNHASVHSLGQSRETVAHWLIDLSKGMNKLIEDRVVAGQLRASRELYDTPCLTGYSLQDAIFGMQRAGYLEEYRFLARLATKSPLLRDMPADVRDRFLGCEGTSVPPETGEPLVLCALMNWVAVGFPSEDRWDQDQFTVQFEELQPDEAFVEASEVVDNLTRYEHAALISQRHSESERLADGIDPAALWKNRLTYFPDVLFGPDVEGNLKTHARLFDAVVRKLIAINRSAAVWKTQGGPAPSWPTLVTDESRSLKQKDPDSRRFASCRGTRELFTWHARVGNGYRIHLRLDAGLREVEIGYIGPHLPL